MKSGLDAKPLFLQVDMLIQRQKYYKFCKTVHESTFMSFMPNDKITRCCNKNYRRCQLDECIPILRSLNFKNLKCLEVDMCDMIIVGM